MLCHLVNTNSEGAYSLLLQSQAAYKEMTLKIQALQSFEMQ